MRYWPPATTIADGCDGDGVTAEDAGTGDGGRGAARCWPAICTSRCRPCPQTNRPRTNRRPSTPSNSSNSSSSSRMSASVPSPSLRPASRRPPASVCIALGLPVSVLNINHFAAKAPSVRRACVACHTGKTRCSEVLPCQVRL